MRARAGPAVPSEWPLGSPGHHSRRGKDPRRGSCPALRRRDQAESLTRKTGLDAGAPTSRRWPSRACSGPRPLQEWPLYDGYRLHALPDDETTVDTVRHHRGAAGMADGQYDRPRGRQQAGLTRGRTRRRPRDDMGRARTGSAGTYVPTSTGSLATPRSPQGRGKPNTTSYGDPEFASPHGPRDLSSPIPQLRKQMNAVASAITADAGTSDWCGDRPMTRSSEHPLRCPSALLNHSSAR